MVIKMSESNSNILDIKVKYNKKKLNKFSDEYLSLIENKIYGNKSELEKIVLELKCIIEHLKKVEIQNVESLERILNTLSDMPSLSIDVIESLKCFVSILEIHLNMDYGFYKSVKHSEQETIEKVKEMSL